MRPITVFAQARGLAYYFEVDETEVSGDKGG
jgi:hypothetical protein